MSDGNIFLKPLFNLPNQTITTFTPQEENRSGADCNGINGDKVRVLTLQNSSLSIAPVSVWVDDQIIAQADMTISHSASSSTITFDNINIYDSQTIRVTYYI